MPDREAIVAEIGGPRWPSVNLPFPSFIFLGHHKKCDVYAAPRFGEIYVCLNNGTSLSALSESQIDRMMGWTKWREREIYLWGLVRAKKGLL